MKKTSVAAEKIEAELTVANFGVCYIEACSECDGDHSSGLNEKVYSDGVLVGYWAVCPIIYSRFLVSVNEVGDKEARHEQNNGDS